jgi:hypothetical protein
MNEYMKWMDGYRIEITCLFLLAQKPYLALGSLIVQVSRSHSETPQDGWSARRRDIHLTTHSTPKRQTSMHPAGFEPAIPASERTHTVRLPGSTESSYAHQKCILINLGHIKGIARIALATRLSIFYVEFIRSWFIQQGKLVLKPSSLCAGPTKLIDSSWDELILTHQVTTLPRKIRLLA